MKKGWALFLQRLKDIPRIALLFFCLFFVALGIIMFYLAEKWLQPTTFIDPFQVALVDEERSFETRMILRQLQQAKELSDLLTFVEASKQEADNMLTKGEVVATLIVPQSFTNDLRKGRNTPLTVEIGTTQSVEAKLFVEMMRSGTNLINASQTAINTTYDYLKDWGISGKALQHETNEVIVYFMLKSLKRGELVEQEILSVTGEYTWSQYYIASLLIVLPFLGSVAILPIVRLSLKSELIKRFISINVGAFPLVISSFCLLCMLGIIQMILLGGMAFFVGSVKSWLDFLLLTNIALFLAAYVCFFASFKEGSAILSIVAGGVLMLIGGLIVPVSFLPEWVQVVEKFSPFYWLHQVVLEHSSVGIFVAISASIFLLLFATKLEKKRLGC